METFSFRIDAEISEDWEPTVGVVKFGDGYEQRQKKTLKGALQVWQASKRDTKQEVDKIVAFFKKHEGLKPFYWVNPDGTKLKVKVSKYSRRHHSADIWDLSWEFEELM